ncbi:MAG: RsmD family RNA methyltransferase [Holosporaceae bacterium]|jgi:16S rRNA G966 N2-methylase RsmD|nr:RsmD family RNA methyltransferase [Holosporaceae bacterium]
MSIKIIAGQYGGIPIAIPKSARPTLSRYRQALFDILAASELDFFYNKTVLDCFAGSGALGIEAISRGATHAYLVDRNKDAISTIMSNISKLKIADRCTLIRSDIMQLSHCYDKCGLLNEKKDNNTNYDENDGICSYGKFTPNTKTPNHCDVAFLDPPYFDKSIPIEQVVDHLGQFRWISKKTIVVVEQSSLITDSIQNLNVLILKKTGNSRFIIGTPK